MVKLLKYSLVVFAFLLVSCKKSDERKCWKGWGDETTIEIPLDSVNHWKLDKKIKYRIFQDDQRKIVVKGGENMIKLIEPSYDGYTLQLSNNNKCDFLRNASNLVEVEIHYPHYGRFYIEPSDSVIFEETMVCDSLFIELREGGGSMVLDVESNFLEVIVSNGTADYNISGFSKRAELKVQHKGYGNASNLKANSYFAYQNSVADLEINLDGANSFVLIEGSGDVYYDGIPSNLLVDGHGSGTLIQK